MRETNYHYPLHTLRKEKSWY